MNAAGGRVELAVQGDNPLHRRQAFLPVRDRDQRDFLGI